MHPIDLLIEIEHIHYMTMMMMTMMVMVMFYSYFSLAHLTYRDGAFRTLVSVKRTLTLDPYPLAIKYLTHTHLVPLNLTLTW